MATFTHKCPHCLTEHIALIIVAQTALNDDSASAYFRCPKCYGPSVARLERTKNYALESKDWLSSTHDISWGWEPVAFYPEPPKPSIPEHLDIDIARVYLQAERNFAIEGNEEAAGTMYRKALDIGLKKVDPEAKGMLAARIRKLTAEHKLTPAIAEWADHIRDIGNDAAHEEEPPTREELTVLRSFTEMVMRYLFTLPKMVELRKDAAAEMLK